MRKNYTVGDGTNDLTLEVIIGTPGLANTVVFQFPGGGQKKKIAESNVDSGNIQPKNIGKGIDYKNSYLKARTLIDFGSIDQSQWEHLAENVIAKIKISGGFSGTQTYSYDEDDKTASNSGRVVIIDLEVNMI